MKKDRATGAPDNRDAEGRFRPGVSGNPGGRPKGLRVLEEALEESRDADHVLAVVDQLRTLALEGDVQAARVYLDRMLGPVRQKVEEAGDFSELSTDELCREMAGDSRFREAIVNALLTEHAWRDDVLRRLDPDAYSPSIPDETS